MEPWLGERYGNPASLHAFGQAARDATEVAREQLASLLGARPAELVFTASGTEANNAVLLGRAWDGNLEGHLVVSAIEHPSVWKAALALQEAGMEVSWVEPDRQGRTVAEEVLGEVREDTRLVCLMLANNEVGTLQPVTEVGEGCRERGVPVLCDAVQAIGKVPVSTANLKVDYLSVGAHKFYGPLGGAALWIRKGAKYEPFLKGGSQERQRRAGTVNVPAVIGLGADIVTGLTATVASLGNIGPGFGAIGPMESFGSLSSLSKLLFIFAMWVGRLEVMTVLVLLHPEVIRTALR